MLGPEEPSRPSSTSDPGDSARRQSVELELRRVASLRELAARFDREAQQLAGAAADLRAGSMAPAGLVGRWGRRGRQTEVEDQVRRLEAEAAWARIGAAGARELAEALVVAATAPPEPPPVDDGHVRELAEPVVQEPATTPEAVPAMIPSIAPVTSLPISPVIAPAVSPASPLFE